MGEEQEQQDKPNEQPESQEPNVPEVEIDPLLDAIIEKMEKPSKETRHK